MTWYSDPDQGYFWIDTTYRHKLPSVAPTGAVMQRKISKSETVIRLDNVPTQNGEPFYYAVVEKRIATEKQVSNLVYPEYPTYELLSSQYSSVALDDKGSVIQVYVGDNIVQLVFRGTTMLRFFSDERFPEGIRFFVPSLNFPLPEGWFQKYLGKHFQVSSVDGIVGIENKLIPWTPIQNNLTVCTKTGTTENINWITVKCQQIVKDLHSYMELLTPEKLESLMAGREAIFTKCHGCRRGYSDHLVIHLQRQEINPFLLYAMYDYGLGEPDGEEAARKLTTMRYWIGKKKEEECERLRKIAIDFFLYHLLSQNLMFESPIGIHPNASMYWNGQVHPNEEEYHLPKAPYPLKKLSSKGYGKVQWNNPKTISGTAELEMPVGYTMADHSVPLSDVVDSLVSATMPSHDPYIEETETTPYNFEDEE